jgi:indolepyruvate decarboxylase
VRSRGELAAALETAARTRGRFQLVEAMLARGSISPALERFVNGIKRLNQAPAEV